jgi:hypothetical protein
VRYRLLAPLTFGPGALLGLSDDQVLRRAHARSLEVAGEGVYRALAMVQFKAGEVLELEDLPRAFEAQVEAVDDWMSPAPAVSAKSSKSRKAKA